VAGKIYFVGSGADPDLVTRRGAALVESAELVIGDGDASPAERIARMAEAAAAGRVVARVVEGDPLFLASREVREEIAALVVRGLHVEVVPGVPSVIAAAARAGVSLGDAISLERGAEGPIARGDEAEGLALSIPCPPRRGGRSSAIGALPHQTGDVSLRGVRRLTSAYEDQPLHGRA
jgi:precorrin-2 methylase